MPYIPDQLRRRELRNGAAPKTEGELAFKIADAVDAFIHDREAMIDRAFNYSERAAVVGTLESTTHEITRRLMDAYENGKRLTNGDVFLTKTIGPDPF